MQRWQKEITESLGVDVVVLMALNDCPAGSLGAAWWGSGGFELWEELVEMSAAAGYGPASPCLCGEAACVSPDQDSLVRVPVEMFVEFIRKTDRSHCGLPNPAAIQIGQAAVVRGMYMPHISALTPFLVLPGDDAPTVLN